MGYRIKITELKNGEFRYTPQVSEASVVGWLFKKLTIRWWNIVTSGYGFNTTGTMEEYYDTEQQAIEVVEQYIKYHEIKQGRKTAKISYKHI
jgi:hypothetical protein